MSALTSESMLLSGHSLAGPPGADTPKDGSAPGTPKDGSFHEIVVCIDGSELGSGVVSHARLVAAAFGSQLTLLHVLEHEPAAGDGHPPDPLDWGIRQREARARLDRVSEEFADFPHIRSELIQGRAAEQICSWAEHRAVDLTVLCSHGARGVTEWYLASTARKLIEGVPGSFLLVPAATAAQSAEPRYRKILVPLDGSPRAESVIPIALRIAAAQQAELLLVHIVPLPEITHTGPLDEEGAELERRVVEHNQRVANAYLDRLRARASQSGCEVRALVVGKAKVQSRLTRVFEEQRADLVVMAAHGHSGRCGSPFGRVTEYALTHTKTPLMVIRERAQHRTRSVGPARARPRSEPHQEAP